MQNMPPAEIDVDADLVRALLADQHRDLADLEIRAVAFGWDNAMFRLGDRFAVRMPRRAMAAPLTEHEQRWLPVLAPRLPVPVPTPLRVGRAALGYPWSWSVVPWIEGEPAEMSNIADPARLAHDLGAFVAALHAPAPAEAPTNPYRGVPLRDRDAIVQIRIDQLASMIDAAAVRSLWEELVAVAQWPGPPMWLHGDLHPLNILVRDGKLAGVVDFGDITRGDPATDLSIAWMLFDESACATFRRAAGGVAGIDDDTWERARGNALAHALAVLAHSADNPTMFAIGTHTLRTTIDRAD